jgi:hypothetical protein
MIAANIDSAAIDENAQKIAKGIFRDGYDTGDDNAIEGTDIIWARQYAAEMGFEGASDFEDNGESFTFKVGDDEYEFYYDAAVKELAQKRALESATSVDKMIELRNQFEGIIADFSTETADSLAAIFSNNSSITASS